MLLIDAVERPKYGTGPLATRVYFSSVGTQARWVSQAHAKERRRAHLAEIPPIQQADAPAAPFVVWPAAAPQPVEVRG